MIHCLFELINQRLNICFSNSDSIFFFTRKTPVGHFLLHKWAFFNVSNTFIICYWSISSSTESAPASDQAPQFILNSPSMTVPDERLHVPHPAVEKLFSETQDSKNANDDTMIINQLLEYPEILNVLNDPSLSMPNNIDLDVDMSHLNFAVLPQDFSQYTELQFNMLVNENQNS